MRIKSIKDAKIIDGKKALVRVDFNVPVVKGKVKDDTKIRSAIPTIEFLLKKNCSVILIPHLGRPLAHKVGKKDKDAAEYSLKPIAAYLEKIIRKKVEFSKQCVGFEAATKAGKLKEKEILMLENLRLEEGELTNDRQFAKELTKLANFYVNDAFAVCHREHASVVAIQDFLPSYAGLLLEKEVSHIYKAIKPKKPLVLVIGGKKIETKIPIIKSFYNKSHKILIGGAVANTFLAAYGYETGRSIIDKKYLSYARKIDRKKIVLPIDVVVSSGINKGKAMARSIKNVLKNDYIYDIGPESIKLYAKFIRSAQTILWNGPMGFFEVKSYHHGTLALATLIAARSKGRAFGVVGGGETIEALKMTKMSECIDWVSTGGGAMLSFLSGEEMPGFGKIIRI